VVVMTSVLKMETAHFSKVLVSTNQSTQLLNPWEYNQNCCCNENLKSHIDPSTYINNYFIPLGPLASAQQNILFIMTFAVR
jgi:hypothetical protein